jgi:sulfate adenylyltransferase subunit 1 (EFTu-like GTPase family)
MDVLKIATAGSDGKSTLIKGGLYDTQSLTTDKLKQLKKSSKQKDMII